MAVDTTAAAQAPVHARATVRPEKAETVAELAQAFRDATAAVLTEYRGLTVKQVTGLRVALGAGTTYSVVKNTLTRRAAADAGLTGLEELLVGPTAVAFVNGEPVEAAKALRDFARANPALVVKGGVLEGKTLNADEVRRLADLESREVLLGKMAGALKASLTNAAVLFAAPLAQTARLAEALRAKAEEDPSVLRASAPAASADAPAAPAADAPAADAPDAGTEAPAEVPADADAAADALATAPAADAPAGDETSPDGTPS